MARGMGLLVMNKTKCFHLFLSGDMCRLAVKKENKKKRRYSTLEKTGMGKPLPCVARVKTAPHVVGVEQSANVRGLDNFGGYTVRNWRCNKMREGFKLKVPKDGCFWFQLSREVEI